MMERTGQNTTQNTQQSRQQNAQQAQQKEFMHAINTILEQKTLLNHPFYRMWQEGKLSKEALKGYSIEYFHLEKIFPGLLLDVYKHTDDTHTQEVIQENYNEETDPKAAHVDLWKHFALSLGATEEQLEKQELLPKTREVLSTFEVMAKQDLITGMTALLAYEANLQKTAETKIHGLKTFYNLTAPEATQFFEVHGVLDIKHANEWKDILEATATTKEQQEKAKQALSKSMDTLWKLLDGIHEKYNVDIEIACA